MKIKIAITTFFVSIPIPALAYIGPGMGGGAIAALIGFFAAFFLALFGILYYPIKRALKNRKLKEPKNKIQDSE